MSEPAQQIPTRRFEKALGPSTTKVWQVCARKAANGQVQLSSAELAKLTHIPQRTVQHSLRRLQQLRLLNTDSTSKGYQVVGQKSGSVVTGLSKQIVSAINAMTPHGGARKGAGRKPFSNSESITVQDCNPKNQVCAHPPKGVQTHPTVEGKTPEIVEETLPRTRVHARGIELTLQAFTLPPPKGGEEIKDHRQAEPGGSDFSKISSTYKVVPPKTPKTVDSEQLSASTLDLLCALDASVSVSPSLGTWRRPGVPPFPSNALVEAPRVPAPPLLDPSASLEDWFSTIAWTWWWAVQAHFKCKDHTLSHAMKSRKYRRSRHWNLLTVFAGQLVEHEVAPASWIAFRFDTWKEQVLKEYDYAAAASPPPMKWVMRGDSLKTHLRWFSQNEAAYAGGRCLPGPRAQLLAADHARMQAALRRLAPQAGPSEVAKTVERFFPGDSFQSRLELARAESRMNQKRLDDMVARGDYAWEIQ